MDESSRCADEDINFTRTSLQALDHVYELNLGTKRNRGRNILLRRLVRHKFPLLLCERMKGRYHNLQMCTEDKLASLLLDLALFKCFPDLHDEIAGWKNDKSP